MIYLVNLSKTKNITILFYIYINFKKIKVLNKATFLNFNANFSFTKSYSIRFFFLTESALVNKNKFN